MTHDFVGWTPPPAAVVKPPVHPETLVDVIYSDGTMRGVYQYAAAINWSSVGDGPCVVAYAVVEEYVEPKVAREWWVRDEEARLFRHWHNRESYPANGWTLVREVLPADPSREVVEPRSMKAVWSARRSCFEIYVTNVDYLDGTTMYVFGDLP